MSEVWIYANGNWWYLGKHSVADGKIDLPESALQQISTASQAGEIEIDPQSYQNGERSYYFTLTLGQ